MVDSELKTFTNWSGVVLTLRLKGLLDKEDQESEVIKDSPDSPEPLNKKPRVSAEEDHPPERVKGTGTPQYFTARAKIHSLTHR